MESTESEKTKNKYMTDAEDDAKQRKELANRQIWKKIDAKTITLETTMRNQEEKRRNDDSILKKRKKKCRQRKKPDCTK